MWLGDLCQIQYWQWQVVGGLGFGQQVCCYVQVGIVGGVVVSVYGQFGYVGDIVMGGFVDLVVGYFIVDVDVYVWIWQVGWDGLLLF